MAFAVIGRCRQTILCKSSNLSPRRPPQRPKRRIDPEPDNPMLYSLRSIPKGNWMGFSADTTTYVVAFKYKEHAAMIRSFAHEATKMHLDNVIMRDITTDVEAVCNVPAGTFGLVGLPPVYADLDARLCINKRPNINKLGCDIKPITTMEYTSIPFEQNLGVVLAFRITDDSKEQISFECEVIEPLRDLDLFRKKLGEHTKP